MKAEKFMQYVQRRIEREFTLDDEVEITPRYTTRVDKGWGDPQFAEQLGLSGYYSYGFKSSVWLRSTSEDDTTSDTGIWRPRFRALAWGVYRRVGFTKDTSVESLEAGEIYDSKITAYLAWSDLSNILENGKYRTFMNSSTFFESDDLKTLTKINGPTFDSVEVGASIAKLVSEILSSMKKNK